MRVNGPQCGRVLAVIAVALCVAQSPLAEETDKNKPEYWLDKYGEYQGPLRERIDAVFERVAAAADNRKNRRGQFAPIEKEDDPYAIALPGGGIVLTKTALEICYPKGVDTGPEGDAKLAFVLGHELSHLATDDAYHLEMIDLGLRFADRPNLKQVELRADAYGLIYAAMAGYDATVVVDNHGAFFDDWVKQVFGGFVYTPAGTPVSVAERVAIVKAKMANVSREIDVFDEGVALYESGRLKEALNRFEAFARAFPGREVFNNIGLTHYQLLADQLGACDGRLVTRYKYPVALDKNTRAVTLRSGETDMFERCRANPEVDEHFAQAESALELAKDSDPDYVPARINLATLYLTVQDWFGGAREAHKAAALSPNDSAALIVKALAVAGLGDSHEALEILRALLATVPDHSIAQFNLSIVAADVGQTALACSALRTFLEHEPTGIFSGAASRRLSTLCGH